MHETTLTEFRKHAKRYFDKIEQGEVVSIYRNGRPIGDLVPVSAAVPVWKKSPKTRLSLKGLLLSAEIIADREKSQ